MLKFGLSCLFFIFLTGLCSGQVFTFECKCDYLSPADRNCDICNTSVLKRHFSGLLIRKNGIPFKWIDEPYTVRQLAGDNVLFIEQIPAPDQITIARFQTQFATTADFLDSTVCQCNQGGTTYIPGPGIQISGDTISALDISPINELQYIDSFYISAGKLYASLFLDSIPASFVTLPVPDGSETIVTSGTGISVTGTGTSGSPYVVTNTAPHVGTNLTYTGTSSPLTLNSSTGTDVTHTAGTGISLSGSSTNMTITNTLPDVTVSIVGAGINFVTGTYPNFTVTGTEVDGSTTNELQTYGHAGTTTYTNTLSGGGGSWSITGAGIAAISQTGGAITVTATEVDGSTTNELQTISVASNTTTLSNSGGSMTIAGAGINVATTSGSTITITGTEVDGSVTNEGLLGVGAGGASSSVLLSNTSGATGVTMNAAGILAISESTSSNGGSITLTATEVDGSITNEIQTISASGAGPTSYNIDLSLSGGSVTLAEGAGIDLTRSGNTITAAVTGVPFGTGTDNYHPKWTTSGTVLSSTSLIYDNSTSIIIGGTTANGRLSIRETSGKNVYIGEGEVKLQGPAVAHWSMRANEGGVAGIYFINTSGGDSIGQSGTTRMYIKDSEVSVTNNFKLGTYSGNAATTVVGRDASNVLTSVSLSGMSLISGTLTATDGSVSNEGVLGVGAGGASSSTIVSTTSSANPVTINVSGILTISESTSANGGSITLTATEVDGSVTNEAQTLSASGTTSGIISLSTAGGAGGGSVTIAAGTGIGVAQSGGTITITNTASSNAWLIDGNTITTARRIGSNDNFDVVVETNGTDRFWFDNAGTVSLGATQLTTAAFNINGLQTGTGMLIAGGGSLVGPNFYTATGSGSGSTATVFSGVVSMVNGNVEAVIQNSATTGTGGSLLTLNTHQSATGDPKIYWTTNGTTDWTAGIDNNASGEPWRLTNNSDLGSGTSAITALATTNRVGVNQNTPTVQLQVSGTDGIGFPQGTTAQRPSSPAFPVLRWNSTYSGFEVWDPNKSYWYRLTAVSSPSVSSNTAAGTGHSAGLVAGAGSNDVRGAIELDTGSASLSAGTVVTVTYAAAYSGTATLVTLTPRNDRAATDIAKWRIGTQSNTGFTIVAVSALTASDTYQFNYYVGQ